MNKGCADGTHVWLILSPYCLCGHRWQCVYRLAHGRWGELVLTLEGDTGRWSVAAVVAWILGRWKVKYGGEAEKADGKRKSLG